MSRYIGARNKTIQCSPLGSVLETLGREEERTKEEGKVAVGDSLEKRDSPA